MPLKWGLDGYVPHFLKTIFAHSINPQQLSSGGRYSMSCWLRTLSWVPLGYLEPVANQSPGPWHLSSLWGTTIEGRLISQTSQLSVGLLIVLPSNVFRCGSRTDRKNVQDGCPLRGVENHPSCQVFDSLGKCLYYHFGTYCPLGKATVNFSM
jgi:hypothetical protein